MQTMTGNQYRLAPQQRRLWAMKQDNRGYRTQAAWAIEGQLDVEKLWFAVRSIVERHEALRTRPCFVSGLRLPAQEILDEARWQQLDPSSFIIGLTEPDSFLLFEQEQERHDLAGDDPPLCLTLFPLAASRHLLLVSCSAFCTDSVTLRNFLAELAAEFDPLGSSSASGESPVQYADYAVWRNELPDQDRDLTEEGRAYWRSNSNVNAPDRGVFEQAAAASPSRFSTMFAPVRIAGDVAARLASLAEQHGRSLESLLLACWGSLLHQLTQGAEIPVSVTLDGRLHDELLSGMGLYAQAVPVSMRFSPEAGFLRLLSETDDAMRQARLWQDYFQWTEGTDGSLQSCRFGFSWSPRPQTHVAGGLTFRCCAEYSIVDRFEVQLMCSGDGEGVSGVLGYNPACFNGLQVEQLARSWESLCSTVSELDSERRQTLHELVEDQARMTPEAVAVVCGDQQASYQEINERANRLAHYLISHGAAPERLVGICLPRGIDLVVSLLAVLKSGAAYLPLDAAYPTQRLRYMLEDSGAGLVITSNEMATALPETTARLICLQEQLEQISTHSSNDPAVRVFADNLAYEIYTSGSTGKPKAVMITHRAIVNHMLWMNSRFPLAQHDAVLQKTSLSFDASVWEFYAPLMSGARLVMAREGAHRDSGYLVKEVAKQRVTVLQVVPSMLRMILREEGLEACQSLRRVYCGGEAMDTELVETFYERLDRVQLVNLYGPTEASIDSTYADCAADRGGAVVTIGRPIANVNIYILDDRGRMAPVGVVGEIHIAGEGLARGYANKPDQTAERFLPDSYGLEAGARIYQTGDLGRYRTDGVIEYVGRVDTQVKLRGYRIEMGEVESALRQQESVKEAVAVIRGETDEQKRIVGYVVGEEGATLDIELVMKATKARLPDYMVPSRIMVLERLPLGLNGKVDRGALPEPDRSAEMSLEEYVPPRTEVERIISEAWQQVLHLEHVSIKSNFFDLGGHSLLMMPVHSELQRRLGREMTLVELFEFPTISMLAEHLSGSVGEETAGLIEDDERLQQGKERLEQQLRQRQKLDELAWDSE